VVIILGTKMTSTTCPPPSSNVGFRWYLTKEDSRWLRGALSQRSTPSSCARYRPHSAPFSRAPVGGTFPCNRQNMGFRTSPSELGRMVSLFPTVGQC
jgi:hypothetical protein